MRENILITGAGRGLGAQLAKQLASPKTRLFLWARTQKNLDEVATYCRNKEAEVHTLAFDLDDTFLLMEALEKTKDDTHLDKVFINAGLFDGVHHGQILENIDSEQQIIDINLKAAIIIANLLLKSMIKRRSGHMIFISSLAAHYPLADAAAYSASKAGLSAYANALREKVQHDNITISDVRCGHIKTDMTEKHQGSLPGLIDTEKAAQIILTDVKRKKALITFPRYLYFLTKIGSILPWKLRAKINKSQRFFIRN